MKNWNIFVKTAIIAFLVFGVVTTVRLNIEIGDFEDKVSSASETIEKLETDIDALTEKVEQKVDEEYIQKIARETLGYYKPSEIVFYNDTAR